MESTFSLLWWSVNFSSYLSYGGYLLPTLMVGKLQQLYLIWRVPSPTLVVGKLQQLALLWRVPSPPLVVGKIQQLYLIWRVPSTLVVSKLHLSLLWRIVGRMPLHGGNMRLEDPLWDILILSPISLEIHKPSHS